MSEIDLVGKMILVKGEFFKDGIKVPLEHGNKAQIALLAKVEAMKDGILASAGFTCVCGERLEKKERECPKCGLRFKYFKYDDKIPCVKLKK